MKKFFLVAALLGGVSLGTVQAEDLASNVLPAAKTEPVSVDITEAEAAQPFFRLDTYYLSACGHSETLYAATKEDAKEYMAWMIETYC